MGLFQYSATLSCCLLLVFKTCPAGCQQIGQIDPGFKASQNEWIDNNGRFLLSKNLMFGFGFYPALNHTLFLLVVIHISSARAVWTANRGSMVNNLAKFVFDQDGNVYLQGANNNVAWSPITSGEKVESVELCDSGNLVLLGNDGRILWQSFSHPTDTLLPGQKFLQGMRLESRLSKDNSKFYLEFKAGDLVLYAGYRTPQIYWSLANDNRKTNNSVRGKIYSATLVSNAWNFYDQNQALLWQFIFANNERNATWAALLGSNGEIIFFNLQRGSTTIPEAIKIPQNFCSIPEPCGPYHVCTFFNQCQCPQSLRSQFNCNPPIALTCNKSKDSAELIYVGIKLDYFALGFATPIVRYSLDACKEACLHNCSCVVLFFENDIGNCFLFDQVGGFQRSQEGSAGYVSYIKVLPANAGVNSGTKENRNRRKIILSILLIIVPTMLVIPCLLYVGIRYLCRKKTIMESSQKDLEEDSFSDSIPVMPVRFSYDDLCRATKNFSTRIGQGGFGSVYLGMLHGTQLAVKKLEGIGQGKKQFRAEVIVIGNVHHVNLVKLKGFCAEGSHRLLVYEYMGNGSLDKWIFKINEESELLSWNTRFSIALGTAKGLAYLHEECEVKIVHCDIKPQNILLDENFMAKVSDFGLAKLMNREESHVHTTLRGTRGYLAPEWITNQPISEKSDIYSYGLVLLEIIGGRKAYDMGDDSEIANFPSYAFKMLEGGKLREILDPKLNINENDERVTTAIKVALWCIQDEMHLRPSMSKVVQMLEGLSAVPQPPTPSQFNSRAYSGFIKWNNAEGTSSEKINGKTDVLLSEVQLSGPR